MNALRLPLTALACLALLATSLVAMGATKAELQERFKARRAQIQQAKSAGHIGEVVTGYLEAVKTSAPADAKNLLNAENADRKELYELFAKEENLAPEQVAQRAARLNFERAKPGEWLKGADGVWKQK